MPQHTTIVIPLNPVNPERKQASFGDFRNNIVDFVWDQCKQKEQTRTLQPFPDTTYYHAKDLILILRDRVDTER